MLAAKWCKLTLNPAHCSRHTENVGVDRITSKMHNKLCKRTCPREYISHGGAAMLKTREAKAYPGVWV